jgi:hypothetical protein
MNGQHGLLVALAGILSITCQPPAFAQLDTGTISGLVTDPGGGVIEKAQVLITATQTKVQRSVTTNEVGRYYVPYLSAGTYEIQVTKLGFKEAIVPHIVLDVNQTARIDVSLEVGQTSASVTVHAEAASFQTDNTTVGGVLDQRTMEELPGRDIFILLGLSTDVSNPAMNGWGGNVETGLQPGNIGSISSNLHFSGARPTANLYLLDGVTNTDWNINAMVNPASVESLDEVRVQVSTSSPAFGNAPGGTINVITRSGTNQLHWEAYDYLQNDALDARPFSFTTGLQPKGPVRQNQFGASVGGPLVRNHTFFFVHFEGLENRSNQVGSSTLPTEEARNGNFSEYGSVIYDPTTLSAAGIRTPFPNDTIPSSRFNSVALKYYAFTPLPNVAGATINNYISEQPSRTHNDQGNARLDDQIDPHDWLSGAFHINVQKADADGPLGAVTGTITQTRGWNGSVNATHVFTPSIIDAVKVGFNRLVGTDGVFGANHTNIIGELGISGLNEDPANWGFPSLYLGTYALPNDSSGSPLDQADTTYHVVNDLSIVHGRHTLQTGGEFRKIDMNYGQTSPARGQFLFSGIYTDGPNPSQPLQNTGNELADFLLGDPQQAIRTVGVTEAYLRTHYYAGYVTDNMRVNKRLSLTFGLHYGFESPPRELRNNYYNLDFSDLPAPPRLIQIGVDPSSLPAAGIRTDRTNWSPVLGLAYQSDSKTVARLGYGIYYQQEMGAIYYDLARNGIETQVANSSILSPQLRFQSPFGSSQTAMPSYYYIEPNSVTPYVQQWNATIQRELPFHMMMELGYVGAKGTHLFRYRSFNTAYQTETGADLPPRPGILQDLRTWPSLGPITEMESSASSIYHALHVRIERRFLNGLSFINSFTWGKSIDDASDVLQGGFKNVGAQDERDLREERGLSDFDVRLRFTSSVIWELPFGKGRRWLNNGVASYLAGPWQISSNLTAQDGFPENYVGYDLNTGTYQRPNLVPGEPLVLPQSQRSSPFEFYNPAAIVWPGPYTIGDAGRNILPTPGALTENLAVFRRFPLRGEGRELIFRAESLNALNNVNLGLPSPFEGQGFGYFLTAGAMRTVTLSLKLRF